MGNSNKILIISHNALSDVQNNGKTLSSFFENYPKQNIAQLFISCEDPSFRICENYYRITDIELLKNFFSSTNSVGNNLKPNESSSNILKNDIDRNIFYSILRKGFQKDFILLDLIRNWFWNQKTWNNLKLKSWLNNFNPDIIFFQGSHLPAIYDMVLYFCKELNIPLIIQATDDYVCPSFSLNLFSVIKRKKLYSVFSKAIKYSDTVVVISEKMKNEYKKLFGGNYYVAMNCCKIIPKTPIVLHEKIRIVYAGNLGLNRWKVLYRFANICNSNFELRNKIEINIFSLVTPKLSILNKLNKFSFMNFKGALTSDELREEKRKADILLHVESFSRKDRVATRYSISTKIPEYLFSNRLIIGIGPTDLASISYLKDNKLALIFDKLDKNEIIKSLLLIVNNSKMLINYPNKAYSYAVEFHSALKIQYEISNIINSAIIKKKNTERIFS